MWQVVGATVIGTGHIKRSIPCQDAFQYDIDEESNSVIVAVADGIGSAAKADIGSSFVVEEVIRCVKEQLEVKDSASECVEEVLLSSIKRTKEGLQVLADSENISVEEFGTTLVVALLDCFGISVAHIGDGAVVLQMADKSLYTLSKPHRGEYENETFSLTSSNAEKFIRISTLKEDVRCVALMTDGLQRLSLSYPTASPHAPFFLPLFERLEYEIDTKQASSQLERFLLSERVCSKTSDDKTLVLAARIGAEQTA